jgi:hypothetical protein
MSFDNAQTPEDLPDYEYEADVARLERHTVDEVEDDDADERRD